MLVVTNSVRGANFPMSLYYFYKLNNLIHYEVILKKTKYPWEGCCIIVWIGLTWNSDFRNSKFIFYFLEVLGFELTVLWLLGSCWTSWTTPPGLFALVIFEVRSCFFAQDHILLFNTSCYSWDDRHTALLLGIGWEQGLSNPDPPDLSLPSS
jgi:hypothetical protein